MTTVKDTGQHSHPAWADPGLTQMHSEAGEADAFRYAIRLGTVEVYQWADTQVDGSLKSPDVIRVSMTSAAEDITISEAEQHGTDLIRAAQFVNACLGTATDIRMLTISDLSRLSKQKNVAFETLLNELVERGLFLRGDEK